MALFLNNRLSLTSFASNQRLSVSSNQRLEYFWQVNDDTPIDEIHDILDGCWDECDKDTVKLIFYKRYSNEGSKDVFYFSYEWLIETHFDCALENLKNIPINGCWKDIWWFYDWPLLQFPILKIVSDQLKTDRFNMLIGAEGGDVSLCAKHTPSIKSKMDKEHHICKKLALELGLNNLTWERDLRKLYLSPLREYLNIPERKMCKNDWENIDLIMFLELL